VRDGLLMDGNHGMSSTPSLLAAIAAIVGKEHASSSDEDRICYGTDATKARALPDVVARPGSAEEVSRILVLANERRFPVYPRGAGSGLTGGALPLRGGVALEMTRMNRLLSVDRDDMIAVVEPGMVLADFQACVERKGLFYPPDPASSDFCTVGGTLAECSGGLHCVKYGVTRDYVLSTEAVLPTGEIIHSGSRTMKSVVGYDIGRLLVGSEGTLCVFTRATLRLVPLPESVRTVMAFFSGIDDAVRAAHGVLYAGIVPRTLEIMDEMTIRCVSTYKPFGIPAGTRAILLAESDGTEEGASREAGRMAGLFESGAALSVERTRDRSEANLLWEIRRAISPALYRVSPGKLNEDVCVPLSRLPHLFHGAGEIAERNRVAIACFGHAGDGNIHVNILYDTDDEDERGRAEKAVGELFRMVLDSGGSISGEHGIGTAKARFLSWEVGEREVALMRSFKRLLDPHDILNPGKIFIE
jgi:glycolate oxidase